MFHDGLPDFVAVSAIFLVAGLVKGVLGMGLPTVAMGLLGLVMPVASAAALLTIPSLATNAWQAIAGWNLAALARRLCLMQVGIVAGVAATAIVFAAPPDAFGRRLLGACLVAYGVIGLLRKSMPRLPAAIEPLAGLVTGAVTGVITGLTGVFVLPAVPYLQSMGLGKNDLAQALGLCFTTSTLSLGAALALRGHIDLHTSAESLLMVLPAVAGMWLGQVVRGEMNEALFRRCFFIGLGVLGAWLLLR